VIHNDDLADDLGALAVDALAKEEARGLRAHVGDCPSCGALYAQLRSAADLGMPMAGVTLAYRAGYFRQSLDDYGNQSEAPEPWSPQRELQAAPASVSVRVGDREVRVAAWRYDVTGVRGHTVPVYLLDTDVEENHPDDRGITAHLYGGDQRYRLAQEAVLGIGGVRLLSALGYTAVETYHLNEGHSALLALALLDRASATTDPLASVRQRCVFTTHTPVPAGHDRFAEDLVVAVLGEHETERLRYFGLLHDGELNMTRLALRASRYANAVSYRHAEVSRAMFPDFSIEAITNGVHAATWVVPAMAELFDRYVPQWRSDAAQLRHAMGIPAAELAAAHQTAKRALCAEIRQQTGAAFAADVFTIGFARGAGTYKRACRRSADLERLRATAGGGRLQIV